MSKQLLFVYGTLKRGFGNNILLRDAEFVGEAMTLDDNFGMATNGSFPAVYRNPLAKAKVTGELYRVTPAQLRVVDELENHPDWYVREPVQTTGGEAWMYFMLPRANYWRPVEPVDGVLTFLRQ